MQKYRPITEFLLKQNELAITTTFQEIERVIGSTLPFSAYAHRAWWANTVSHPQAKSWMDVGWKIRNVNMEKHTVILDRPIYVLISELGKKGKDAYSAEIGHLFRSKPSHVHGQNGHPVKSLKSGAGMGIV
jgi:hypothetical protein